MIPFPTSKKKDISNLSDPNIDSQQEEQDIDEEARARSIDNTDRQYTTYLKLVLSAFICILILLWFYFMKSTVNFYLYHYHILEKSAPESVIIATITLGATITGLMVIILKGLFGTK
ncbi:hypothetical protein V9J84_003527 [Vibrio cholerae]|uniref:hypothetical protein n=1 Tax=Vibrio cholerae TaxID=666 RepID=UPI002A00C334|nr:hypothetical protein [Vibrio cholerae]EJL6834694.1 hypothetical protein [Vibrio cholerae]EMC7822904.1 hypothetical protein [Vibrio cholerae]